MTHPYVTIVTSEKLRVESLDYIEAKLRSAYNCEPPETKGVVCVARVATKIVAALVIQGTTEDVALPLEEQYVFDRSRAPFPFCRSELLQATRWTSSHQLGSIMVIHRCATLGRDMGKKYMLIEAKPHAVTRIREIGIVCEEIPAILDGTYVRKRVGEAGMKYYLTDPTPRLYMLPIKEMLQATSKQIQEDPGTSRIL